MAMKCGSCGWNNLPSAKYCEVCGMTLARDYTPVRRVAPKRTGRWIAIGGVAIAVVIVAALVILLGFGNNIVDWETASFSDDLKLYYDYGGESGNPTVRIAGNVTNIGENDFEATLQLTISDSRGWVFETEVDLGTILAGTGKHVDETYYWASSYNDQPLQSVSGNVIPTWTHYIMTV